MWQKNEKQTYRNDHARHLEDRTSKKSRKSHKQTNRKPERKTEQDNRIKK